MSRSYKHTPRSGDKKDKFFKRYANRKLRHKKLTNFLQHKSYKKDFCSYDICDYETIGLSFEEFWEIRVNLWRKWNLLGLKDDFPNKEEERKKYYRWFLRK